MMPVSNAVSTSGAVPAPFAQTTPYRSRVRSVLVVSSDSSLRERLRDALTGLRWQVLEAQGGADAWVASQATQLEALLIDPWLPDLDVVEFLRDFHVDYPHVDVMLTDGAAAENSPRSPYHQELLYALRRSQEGDTAAWQAAASMEELGGPAPLSSISQLPPLLKVPLSGGNSTSPQLMHSGPGFQHGSRQPAVNPVESNGSASMESVSNSLTESRGGYSPSGKTTGPSMRKEIPVSERIPTLIGTSPLMLDISRRIRLVAERTTPVLIEGPTGSGKELVAEALHRLSNRSRKPFVAINCAAIPEALLESELFGHTRGAFTGAVQGRTGRIESADGGTLFLDEIGEMPLGLQSKLLRFFENGELQRIGDNETVKVDVRIVAATHQRLAEDAQKGLFRSDLYYRLAVFLIHTPALADHLEDLPQLVSHFMDQMGRRSPVKRIDASAMARLTQHTWPGNVRELEHVLERAAILVGSEPVITTLEIDFGQSLMN